MTTINVWPAPGFTVVLNGVTVPPSGATVEPNSIVTGLIRQGKLLTYQPDPDYPGYPIPIATSGGTYTATVIDVLSSRSGIATNEAAVVAGLESPGDGAGGQFYWDPTSDATADGALVLGSAPLGRWKRIWDGISVDVRWYGAKFDGVTDDTAAIQAAIDACPKGGTVVCPRGTAIVNDTIVLKKQINFQGQAPSPITDGFTRLMWNGPEQVGGVYKSMLQVQEECRVDGVYFGVLPNRTCYVGMAFDFFSAVPGATPSTQCHISRCIFLGRDRADNAVPGVLAGRMKNCIAIGALYPSGNNLEFMRFTDCAFGNFETYGVWIESGQPYGIEFNKCGWGGRGQAIYNGLPGNSCWGTAIAIKPGSSSLVIKHPNFSFMEKGVVLLPGGGGSPGFITIDEADAEGMKRLIESYGFNPNTRGAITIRGGRYDRYNNKTGGTISLDDNRFVSHHWMMPLSMIGVWVGDNEVNSGKFQLEVAAHTGVSIQGCSFSIDTADGLSPVVRLPNGLHATQGVSGGTVIQASKVTNPPGSAPDGFGYYYHPIPTHDGPENPPGSVTVSGGSPIATVTLPKAETNNTYKVLLTLETFSSSPAAGATTAYATNKTTTGFDVVSMVAPGVGSSVTFNWKLVL